jgi:hypothetical protein
MHPPVNTPMWIVATIACAIALTAQTGCGSDQKVPTIRASELRASLARSGLRIEPRRGHPRKAHTEVVGGIAHGAHGARVEFEFVVVRGRRAHTDELGTLDIPFRSDGLNRNRPLSIRTRSGTLVSPVIRGVLGNVAYATYYFGIREAPPTATEDVVRRLDAALFDTFPATDPEAHAIRRTP